MTFADTRLPIAVLLLLVSAACNDPQSPRGFSLPLGDIDRGREAFVMLECTTCHEVVGEDLPQPERRAPDISVRLGGETMRVRTYGELVTSIINPSHRIAQGYRPDAVAPQGVSRMTVYNDVMTVSQLIDLVAFLESHYELPEYPPTDYPLIP